MDDHQVLIPAEYLRELEMADDLLSALLAGGVDNWEGYEAAIEAAAILREDNTHG